MSQGARHLKSWQRELKFREEKMHECLHRLFEEADNGHRGVISWNQFNSMLIEKGLNLKSLRNQEPGNTALMKAVPVNGFSAKHNNPIQKMVSLGNKIAMFTEESNQIDFYNVDGSLSNLKPLILSQQSLMVETSITKRNKAGSK
jgi:ADP-ribosylglycohydrolase